MPAKASWRANSISADFRDYVIRYMRDFYAKTFPAGAFADKTPGAEAIAGAPLIRLAFPEARIILTPCFGKGRRISGAPAIASAPGVLSAKAPARFSRRSRACSG